MAKLRFDKNKANSCFNCKYNQIKIIMNAYFDNGEMCTGCCTHPDNVFYYNSIKATCDLWEAKNG